MTLSIPLPAYCVRCNADSRQTGAAIIRAKRLTHKELIIKGRNPKEPCSGFQTDEKRRCSNELSCRSNDDLKSSPAVIANGIRMIRIRHIIIHRLWNPSFIFLYIPIAAKLSDLI